MALLYLSGLHGICIIAGLSTDTKPAPTINFTFIETDTNKLYLADGAAWNEVLNDAYEVALNKGTANGYAGLDAGTKVPVAQLPTGATSLTVCIGDDARLADARTPLAHASNHTTGADKIATGTPDGTKFLRDDFSWQAPPGGAVVWGAITGTLANQSDLQAALDAKQATLVSGTNIKTINGSTVLGSGDLVVSAGDPSYSPGSFTVATETQRLAPHRLKMTTTQRITIEGTGRLSCMN